MKVWEETWEAQLHGNACDCPSQVVQLAPPPTIPDDRAVCIMNDGGRARAMHPRAQLISAAPEMARALLECLEPTVDRDGQYECRGCGTGKHDAFTFGVTLFEHRDDCAIQSALRKAGVAS